MSLLRLTMLGLLLSLCLSSCGGEICFNYDRLVDAANNELKVQADGTKRYDKPPNVWIDNPAMAEAVRWHVKETGMKFLSEKGIECSPRTDGGCSDCHTCAGIVRQTPYAYTALWPMCRHTADTEVRAEIGPGTAVTAMTRWVKR